MPTIVPDAPPCAADGFLEAVSLLNRWDAPACPACGAPLAVINRYTGGRSYQPYSSCTSLSCGYLTRLGAVAIPDCRQAPTPAERMAA